MGTRAFVARIFRSTARREGAGNRPNRGGTFSAGGLGRMRETGGFIESFFLPTGTADQNQVFPKLAVGLLSDYLGG